MRTILQFYDWDKILVMMIVLELVMFCKYMRELSNLSDEYADLNEGCGEGVSYRGLAFIEIDTIFGEKPVHHMIAQ